MKPKSPSAATGSAACSSLWCETEVGTQERQQAWRSGMRSSLGWRAKHRASMRRPLGFPQSAVSSAGGLVVPRTRPNSLDPMRVRTSAYGLMALFFAAGCTRDPRGSASTGGALGSAPSAPSSDSCPLPPKLVVSRDDDKNLEGRKLESCSGDPLTGYFRDGLCSTGEEDTGRHVVCAKLTREFLDYTKSQGNDLVTPRGSFPGLSAGQRWCVCAARWREAYEAGVAPPVVVAATHTRAASIVPAEALRMHALPKR